jgi:hypothetical protein
MFRRWGDSQPIPFWLESDDDLDLSFLENGAARRNIRWGAIAGLALALAVSASFWTGLGLVIARIWR